MIWALIRKDLRLLRIYLRSFIAAIFICFAVSAVSNLMLAWAGEELVEDTKTLFSSILSGGSMFGILLVIPIFSSLLPASVLTLERSDRSSQFLACLPPTRLQIYLSKLIVIAVVVFFFFSVCLLTWFLANQLFHETALDEESRRRRVQTPHLLVESLAFFAVLALFFAKVWDALSLFPFIACIASTIGGSLLASVWSKSNAVPTLCGVLTPIAIGFALVIVKLPEDPLNVFSLVASGVSLFCIVVSGCVYAVQREF
jgi:hypothetical protein